MIWYSFHFYFNGSIWAYTEHSKKKSLKLIVKLTENKVCIIIIIMIYDILSSFLWTLDCVKPRFWTLDFRLSSPKSKNQCPDNSKSKAQAVLSSKSSIYGLTRFYSMPKISSAATLH